MREQNFKIDEIPVILLGKPSDKVFLFIHGQGGHKEEAKAFSEIACPLGWQVLGIDLPKHGERIDVSATFDPWHVVPELQQVMRYAQNRWKKIGVRANSIGSYFSILAFSGEPLAQCLLVSPLLDMTRMIEQMMHVSGVTAERLEREKLIETEFGVTLSWEYLCYVRRHPIEKWDVPTYILRAEGDEVVDEDSVTRFKNRFGCKLTVVEGGEHWFHTPEQLTVLEKWERGAINACDLKL